MSAVEFIDDDARLDPDIEAPDPKPKKAKSPGNIAELALRYDKMCIRTLVELMKDKGTSESVRANCAGLLLQYAYGKPGTQETVKEDTSPIIKVTI